MRNQQGFTPLESPDEMLCVASQVQCKKIQLKRKHSLTGFTLIELMIGIAIFVGVAITIGLAFLRGLALNESSQNLGHVIYRLQQKAEEVKNFKTVSTLEEVLNAYNGQSFQLTDLGDNRGTIEILGVGGVPPGQLYRMAIEISWRDKDGHVIGEDLDLDGVLDIGEDIDGNGRLDSPAQIVTYLSP
ncbi:MAG: hypothetical protein COV74_06240 [Candidatus Omnitrophica bacterium CG11_big_fil_rev_8_21_14_0_20_45_26]|uniref:Prepilin-type N-terminal cleavage/methylation domain-containing protein n=1 Tax=Candidatus Abzuiibacterium crystallinum TaxID=1974748 RepID=A0A2H0LNT8_9BACT|nr:MAG: hypothetical protein COV74_06240 [Candidatus Omnitrophica bacterium CG11_big_fil_rev_8_21_14_0_20_45_26]PIW65643.1 MAG: hypothetical protein COW12_00620 [Candidatus Omnitrophica bacterium CG12_big_fil_rev_8_21_14_0_65_45_16]